MSFFLLHFVHSVLHFIYSHFWFAFPVPDFINKLIEILIIYNEINPVQQFSRSTPSPSSNSPIRPTRFSYLAFPSSTGLRLYCLISRFAFRFSHLLWLLFSLSPKKKECNSSSRLMLHAPFSSSAFLCALCQKSLSRRSRKRKKKKKTTTKNK